MNSPRSVLLYLRKFSFTYSCTIFKKNFLPKSTSPQPNYIQIVGHLIGVSPFFAHILAFCHLWKSSYTSLRPSVWAANCGFHLMEWLGEHYYRSSSSCINQRQVSKGALQQEGPNSSRWVSHMLDLETNFPRCSVPRKHAAARTRSVPLLLQPKGGFWYGHPHKPRVFPGGIKTYIGIFSFSCS